MNILKGRDRVKKCSKCGEQKRRDEFYRRYMGNYYTWCKACNRLINRKYKNSPAGKTNIASHILVIEELKRQGIYACSGNGSEYPDADIVAWGCVSIEVKWARPAGRNNRLFTFRFSPKQAAERVIAELVVLIPQIGDDYSFHVLPANHPVFFKQDGTRKGSACWTPGTTPKSRQGYNPTVDDAIMATSKDKWCEIEKVRLSMIEKMRE